MKLKVRIYRKSILATILSIFGTLLFALGVFVGISEHEWLNMACFLIIGILFEIFASCINNIVSFYKWKNRLKKNNLEPIISNSIEAAVSAYSVYPCKRTLKYIKSLNSNAAVYIENNLLNQ